MNSALVMAVIGPTASGKTALAVDLAKKYAGEIICADSRTVYRGMDVGTAKPTAEEREQVPHHLLDVVAPDEPFSVADFKLLAARAIEDIHKRGKLPIVVGGSGLYVDALLYDFQLRSVDSDEVRQTIAALSDEQLRHRVKELGLALNSSDAQNRRRLERVVSSGLSPKELRKLPDNYRIIGINPGMEVLEMRIAKRTKQWFEKNILEETDVLVTTFGPIEPLNTTPYREIRDYLEKGGDLGALHALINLHLRQLAKRQLTWFKRNPDIGWATSSHSAAALLAENKSA